MRFWKTKWWFRRAEQAPGDAHVEDFARLLSSLQPVLPISESLKVALGGGSPDASHYPDERAHMTDWFRGQATRGGGQYTRATPNVSAKRAYNRVLNPVSVLWIAEALGEDKKVLTQAKSTVLGEPDYRSRSAAVRRLIPWERVFELVEEYRKTEKRSG